MKKTIAVLITSHNRKIQTTKCLTELYKSEKHSQAFLIDVYLLDDGSVDGTTNAIRKAFPELNIIQGNGNLFWNRGMIMVWKEAVKQKNYDYFLWLNDDTYLESSSVSEMLEEASYFKNKVIVCGVTKSSINNKITYGGISKKSRRLIVPNGTYQKCDLFNGNIVLIPFCVFEKLGYLNPIFHHGLGDIEYGFRAEENGVDAYITKSEVGYCEQHETFPTWCNPNVPFNKRLKEFYKPKGAASYQRYLLEKRYRNILVAVFHLITTYFRLLFPKYYLKLKNI